MNYSEFIKTYANHPHYQSPQWYNIACLKLADRGTASDVAQQPQRMK